MSQEITLVALGIFILKELFVLFRELTVTFFAKKNGNGKTFECPYSNYEKDRALILEMLRDIKDRINN
ncbi:MAG: hypothetical protein AMQ22_00232 [Candidatus Methanofastidiosum methylothiophilum]|uniref:Uncharacterized protein n=1 Tax=Candidatus Methanofastidiosum methylothiophilum TaxID=1705564 RepID=A0A150J8N3_9EURY|nr:MAG: hypothetical protein AMQ22_00232 [Candidatus Methanofastidiosum methylthiophilus]